MSNTLTLPTMSNTLAGTTAINVFNGHVDTGFENDSDNEFASLHNLDFIGDNDNAADLTNSVTEFPTYTPTEEPDYWPAYMMWIHKTFSLLSILASYVICREVVANLRSQQQRGNSGGGGGRRNSIGGGGGRRSSGGGSSTHNTQATIARIMLSLSVSDILLSSSMFLGEWAEPTDTPYIHHAKGNRATCNFQGWLSAFGYITSPMFNVALNLAFLLLIRYRWTDLQLRKLEFPVTVGIWIYGFVLSIIPIPLDSYNANYDVCWIAAHPMDCIGDECEWGQAADKLRIYYSYIHVWLCIAICLGLMTALFVAVRQIEKRTDRWRRSSIKPHATSQSLLLASSNHSQRSMLNRSCNSFDSMNVSVTDLRSITTAAAAAQSAAAAASCSSHDEFGADDDTDEELGIPDGDDLSDDELSDADICVDRDDESEEESDDEDDEPKKKRVSIVETASGTNTNKDGGDDDDTEREEVDDTAETTDGRTPTTKDKNESSNESGGAGDGDEEHHLACGPELSSSSCHRSKEPRRSSMRLSRRRSSTRTALSSSSRRGSMSVAWQGILYTVAFLCTHLLDLIATILFHSRQIWSLNLDTVAYMIFQPSLGVFNLLIYCRNRKKMSTPEGRFARAVLFFPCRVASSCFGRAFCRSGGGGGEGTGTDVKGWRSFTTATRNSSESVHVSQHVSQPEE